MRNSDEEASQRRMSVSEMFLASHIWAFPLESVDAEDERAIQLLLHKVDRLM